MGSPVSPIVCNLYMEAFEERALSTAPRPPSLWLRYVDDTFVKTHEYDVDSLTQHINNIDPHIKFTIEPEEEGKLPFLDLCINVLDDGATKITIYRKPTHTDQYLNFNSHHPLVHKRSVVRTLINRAKQYVTTPEDKKGEVKHVEDALRANNYQEWALKIPTRTKSVVTTQDVTQKPTQRRPMLGLPYVEGLSEKLSRVYKSHGVNMYHKAGNTLRSSLVHPKDKTPKEYQCGTIYHITCDIDPSHTYIGESKRPFGVRFKEHTKLDKPTGVGDHCNATGHSVSLENTKILEREQDWMRRKVKEAIHIKQQKPTMNRDQGYQLPAIYNRIIPPMSELRHDRNSVREQDL